MAGLSRVESPHAVLRHLKYAAPLLMRLLRHALTRSHAFSTAAQPLLEPDYYYEFDELPPPPRGRSSSAAMTDLEGSVRPPRGVQWVFIGNPGAKRRFYAEKISKLLQVPHISMACLVRQDLSPCSALYKQIAKAVDQGKIVTEEITFGLLSKRLEDGLNRGETGFILDGFPRTQIQAEILDQLVDIDLVVNFKCMDDHFRERFRNGIFPHSHETFAITSSSAKFNTISKDTGLESPMSNEERVWQEKASYYENQIKPLEDYYRRKKKLLNFQVGNEHGETWQGLLAALHLKQVNAARSLPSGSGWL